MTNDLKSNILDQQAMPGRTTEAARLRQDLSKARKVVESCVAKLASLREVGDAISTIKKKKKSLSSATNAQECRLAMDALTR